MYILSYGLNYLLGLAVLAACHQVIRSPYLDGAIALVIVSVINYVVLKSFVFRRVRDQR
jgi:putative flippase GtrA